jgi:hypothetical protein
MQVEKLQRELEAEKANNSNGRSMSPPKSRGGGQPPPSPLSRSNTANSNASFRGDSSDAVADARKYKRLYESLKEQNEINSLVSASTGQLPLDLKQEFIKFCKKHNVLTELKEKEMTEGNCIRILKSKIRAAPPPKSVTKQADANEADVQLQERIKGLEGELRLALGATEDIRALKAKLLQCLERIRLEKEARLKTEADYSVSRRKVEMMTDHMEKLMIHLKQGAAARDRVADQLHEQERVNAKTREKCDLLSRKNAAKDRFILELREGSKVLEDQLRLMDEKYLELRTKLDYARDLGAKKVKKAERSAKELRIKFALSTNGSMMLDQIPLPPLHSTGGNGNGSMGMVSQSLDGDSWVSNQGPAQQQAAAKRGKAHAARAKGSNNGNFDDGNNSMAMSMTSFNDDPPDIDKIFEKIRQHGDEKRDWSEDKLKKLAHGEKMSR